MRTGSPEGSTPAAAATAPKTTRTPRHTPCGRRLCIALLVAVAVALTALVAAAMIRRARVDPAAPRLSVFCEMLNALGLLLVPVNLWPGSQLTLSSMEQRAAALVGTPNPDFGYEFDGAHARFQAVIDAVAAAGEKHNRVITPLGRILFTKNYVRLLASRAQAQAVLRNHSDEILATKLAPRPVIVVGMPRTGTSAMSRLLGAAPGLRPLLTYEAYHPAGVPGSTVEDFRAQVNGPGGRFNNSNDPRFQLVKRCACVRVWPRNAVMHC